MDENGNGGGVTMFTKKYFCSTGCKAAFDRDPGKYVSRSGQA